ncbi:MAG: DNA/RNA non-specific endonuclease [Elusimicrobia bacterium]|nr:DNA/RNA non-specific endonuclease [Elusimicrobiota bacterium]
MVLLLAGAAWGAELPAAEPRERLIEQHLPYGLPSTGELLFRRGYVAGHNNWLKIPNWVAYHLPAAKIKGDTERAKAFVADPELKPFQRAEPEDYKGSGYDRGHMAPAADMKTDPEEMEESFLLSNVTPQVGKGFNRGVWKKLEDRVRRWSQERDAVWVVTGPVFVPEGDMMKFQLIGKRRVAVPTHFFKIVYSRGAEARPAVIAFILPNAPSSAKELADHITTVDLIEERTGLDFFSALEDGAEESLESRKAESLESW